MAKIVLAEDDQMLAEIYQTRLEMSGRHTCKVAHDGLSALTMIHSEMPDLVLLDLMMPQLSGDQVLQRMRQTDWGKDIKAIFLTNISESEAPLSLNDLQFERYIVKVSLKQNDLVNIVNETLGLETSST